MPKEWVDILRAKMLGNTINPKGESNRLFGVPRSTSVKEKISKTKSDNPLSNPSFKGIYITPFGIFTSIRLAPINSGITTDRVRCYCSMGKIVTRQIVRSSNRVFTEEQVGMPLQEIGWYFVSKDDEQFAQHYQNLTS